MTKGVTRTGDIVRIPPETSGRQRPTYHLHCKNMIKRIELINFMSHQHTVIEPSAGLTVLVGPNNCGKSAIVTALQILCNNPKSTYVLRHGTKECKVIVETDSGDVIQWSRKKNGSPTYVINGETFDRLKGKVPEKLHEVLRMPRVQVDKESFDVHFGEQTSPLFLLGDKEKAAAQFFASSSDAIRLVEMQDRHKSNVKFRKNDLKRLSKERESLETINQTLASIPLLHQQAIACEQLGGKITEEKKQLQELQDAVANLAQTRQRQSLLVAQGLTLEKLPQPPELQPVGSLEETVDAIESTQTQKHYLQGPLLALSTLQSPPEIEATEPLENWILQWQQSQRTREACENRLEALAKLANPPKVLTTGELQNTIQQIEYRQQQHQSQKQRLESLTAMPQVPQLHVTAELEQQIDQYDQLQMQLTQQTDLVQSVKATITAIEDEMEDWLVDNPQCPTCGGEISKEQLLEQTGGHVHVKNA